MDNVSNTEIFANQKGFPSSVNAVTSYCQKLGDNPSISPLLLIKHPISHQVWRVCLLNTPGIVPFSLLSCLGSNHHYHFETPARLPHLHIAHLLLANPLLQLLSRMCRALNDVMKE